MNMHYRKIYVLNVDHFEMVLTTYILLSSFICISTVTYITEYKG